MSYLGKLDADLLSQSVFLSYSALSICSDDVRFQLNHRKVMLTLALSLALLVVEVKTTARCSLFPKR